MGSGVVLRFNGCRSFSHLWSQHHSPWAFDASAGRGWSTYDGSMSTDLGIDGVTVGHWTNAAARTGVTVVRFPETTLASGEVRGGAPATREFELLHPERMVERLDALVLTGGSAFGLAAADGVAADLAAADIGFPTSSGPVPIVVAMALFDLRQGDGSTRPGPLEGSAALARASSSFEVGAVGAGTGATVGKWAIEDPTDAPAGGIGAATVRRRVGDGRETGEAATVTVSALMAVNAAGHIDDGTWNERVLAGTAPWPEDTPAFENTTIGLVVTDAKLSKRDCQLLAQGGHDGMARAIFPPHTSSDGDAVVAAATGEVDAVGVSIDVIRSMAVVAVEAAIRASVVAA